MKKNLKRRLAFILALMLALTSFEVIGVFGAAAAAPTTVAPAAPTVTAQASYNAVVLVWPGAKTAAKTETKEDGTQTNNAATSYDVFFNGTFLANVPDPGNVDTMRYEVKNLDPYTVYNFAVQAKNSVGVSAQTAVTGQPVRDIMYALTIKQSGKLKSHAGARATMKVKSGQTVYAYGFAGGKYILRNNGSVFYVARTRVGRKKALTSNGLVYTKDEAENYVNGRGLVSPSGTLIWLSTYTQHLYLFAYVNGKWSCVDNWAVSTGTASTPTPTSIDGLKKITKHTKNRHGIKYWSFFHGTAGFHGVKKGWSKKLGSPASNGCVRNPNEKAKIIYMQPKGTKVVIF